MACFQTLIACDTLTVDQREITIEAAPQLANRGRRRVSHRSVELAIASDSEPGNTSTFRVAILTDIYSDIEKRDRNWAFAVTVSRPVMRKREDSMEGINGCALARTAVHTGVQELALHERKRGTAGSRYDGF